MDTIKKDGEHEGKTYWIFYCVGCKGLHRINTTGNRPKWTFDNNMQKPTISPSVLVSYNLDGKQITQCHLFIKAGKIQYLNDCKHELAGKTIDMVDINGK